MSRNCETPGIGIDWNCDGEIDQGVVNAAGDIIYQPDIDALWAKILQVADICGIVVADCSESLWGAICALPDFAQTVLDKILALPGADTQIAGFLKGSLFGVQNYDPADGPPTVPLFPMFTLLNNTALATDDWPDGMVDAAVICGQFVCFGGSGSDPEPGDTSVQVVGSACPLDFTAPGIDYGGNTYTDEAAWVSAVQADFPMLGAYDSATCTFVCPGGDPNCPSQITVSDAAPPGPTVAITDHQGSPSFSGSLYCGPTGTVSPGFYPTLTTNNPATTVNEDDIKAAVSAAGGPNFNGGANSYSNIVTAGGSSSIEVCFTFSITGGPVNTQWFMLYDSAGNTIAPSGIVAPPGYPAAAAANPSCPGETGVGQAAPGSIPDGVYPFCITYPVSDGTYQFKIEGIAGGTVEVASGLTVTVM